MPNPKSTAAIAGHPIHPMLVPLPIAFFIGAFLCDLVFWQGGGPGWATGALWLLGAGLIGAAAAAVMGAIDVAGEPTLRSTRDLWLHAGGNVLVVVIELYNWISRYRFGEAAVLPTGLILSLIAVAILGFTGWKGGELVFKHRVGVADPP
jgi:uncharacterized membrane protein